MHALKTRPLSLEELYFHGNILTEAQNKLTDLQNIRLPELQVLKSPNDISLPATLVAGDGLSVENFTKNKSGLNLFWQIVIGIGGLFAVLFLLDCYYKWRVKNENDKIKTGPTRLV